MESKHDNSRIIPNQKRKQKPELNMFPLDPNYPPYVLPQPTEDDIKNKESKVDKQDLEVSCVSCFHRPNRNQLKLFQSIYGLTLVITCLGPNEDPKEIKKICKDLGIKNIYIEMNGANKALLGTRKMKNLLKDKLPSIYTLLKNEKHRALVHCAAGIHRTGVVTFMIQRMFGYSKIEAENNLALIRIHTYKGVGSWRIEYAENLVSQLKLTSLNAEENKEENKDEVNKENEALQEEKDSNDVEEDLEMIKKLSISSDRHKTPERKAQINSEDKLECELSDEKDLRKAPGWV